MPVKLAGGLYMKPPSPLPSRVTVPPWKVVLLRRVTARASPGGPAVPAAKLSRPLAAGTTRAWPDTASNEGRLVATGSP